MGTRNEHRKLIASWDTKCKSQLENTSRRTVWDTPQSHLLRIFESWAFVYALVEKREGLDDRAIKCHYFGYLARMKGWKIWDPVKKSFIMSVHARWLDESDLGDGV